MSDAGLEFERAQDFMDGRCVVMEGGRREIRTKLFHQRWGKSNEKPGTEADGLNCRFAKCDSYG